MIVKVNDRGPFLHNRVIDLSYAAAYKLGVVTTGTALVEVTAVNPGGAVNTASYATATPVTSRSVSGPRLYVQYGAFSVKSNALVLQRKLMGHGIKPFIERGVINDSEIYRVRVGPYKLVSEVDEITARSRQFGYESKLVVE